MLTHLAARYGQDNPPYEPGQMVEIVNSDDPDLPIGMQADIAEVLPVSDPTVQEDYPSGWQIGVRSPLGGGIAYVDAGDLVRLAADEYPVTCAWCGKPMGTAEVPDSHGVCDECRRKIFEEEPEGLREEALPEWREKAELSRMRRGGGFEMSTSIRHKIAALNRHASRLARGGGPAFDRAVYALHAGEESAYRWSRASRLRRRAQPFLFDEPEDVSIGLADEGMGGSEIGSEEPITPSDVNLETITPEHIDDIEAQIGVLEEELDTADEGAAADAVGDAGEALEEAEEAMGEGGEEEPTDEEEGPAEPEAEEEELEAEAVSSFLRLRTGTSGRPLTVRERKRQ